jgi:ParB-like nuclease domain
MKGTVMADSTKDYKKFKFLNGNRDVNQAHLKKIARSMALNPELLPVRPILVNEDFEIIDGQHRYTAAQELGLPIYYEVAKGLKATDAIDLNRNQRNWTLLDYAKAYKTEGNKNYSLFLEFVEEFKGISPSTIMVFMRGGQSQGMGGRFRAGEFIVADEELARTWLEQLNELKKFNRAFKQNRVAIPTLNVFKNDEYEHERMLSKMALYGDTVFRPYGNSKDIVRSLEDVYNWRQRGDMVRF